MNYWTIALATEVIKFGVFFNTFLDRLYLMSQGFLV